MPDPNKVVRISASVVLPISDCCHTCGYGPLNGATGVQEGSEAEVYSETGGWRDPLNPPKPMQPTKGSVSICGRCGELMIFDVDTAGRLGVRLPVDCEITELKANIEQWELLERLRAHATQKRHWGNINTRKRQ